MSSGLLIWVGPKLGYRSKLEFHLKLWTGPKPRIFSGPLNLIGRTFCDLARWAVFDLCKFKTLKLRLYLECLLTSFIKYRNNNFLEVRLDWQRYETWKRLKISQYDCLTDTTSKQGLAELISQSVDWSTDSQIL